VRVVFVNRFFYPDLAPTGLHAADDVDGLVAAIRTLRADIGACRASGARRGILDPQSASSWHEAVNTLRRPFAHYLHPSQFRW
jgi:hypothetical protein